MLPLPQTLTQLQYSHGIISDVSVKCIDAEDRAFGPSSLLDFESSFWLQTSGFVLAGVGFSSGCSQAQITDRITFPFKIYGDLRPFASKVDGIRRDMPS